MITLAIHSTDSVVVVDLTKGLNRQKSQWSPSVWNVILQPLFLVQLPYGICITYKTCKQHVQMSQQSLHASLARVSSTVRRPVGSTSCANTDEVISINLTCCNTPLSTYSTYIYQDIIIHEMN